MANASLFAGLTQGLSQVADYERERPAREMRQQEAQQRQQRSQMEMQEFTANAPLRRSKAELELEQLQGEVAAMRRERNKASTFAGFRAYEGDGDVRHLNNTIKAGKAGKDPMWDKWTRMDLLTRTPQTEAMLGQAGITDLDDYFSDPDLVKSKVLATDANGEQTLIDMNKLYQGTGYTQQMTAEELQTLRQRAQIDQILAGTESADTNIIGKIAEENNISLYEATKLYHSAKGSGKTTGSSVERIAQKIRDDAAAEGQTISYEESLSMAAKAQASPSGAEKDIELTDTVREKLHALSPTGSFYDADLNDPKTREKAGELIVDLERASGKKWDAATKKVARQLNSLLKLGGSAGEKITDAETGILDNMFHKVKKYFTDSTDGVEATAAYELFRNIQRNALYGATLPKGEIQAFNAAMGSLNMQLGPVLQQMQVSMQDTKEQLQTIMDFEDPMVVKYRLGMTMDQAEAAVDAIDERLRYFQSYESKVGKSLTLKDVQAAPKVQVNVPAQITPDGTKPELTPRQAWDNFKGKGAQ